MIELFDVTLAHDQTTSLTFELLSTVTIEKSCVKWNFVPVIYLIYNLFKFIRI